MKDELERSLIDLGVVIPVGINLYITMSTGLWKR